MAARRIGQPKSSAHVTPEVRVVLATNLRAARLAAGLTQTQLGHLAEVSRDYIRRIEASDANVSIDILAAIARHVGKTPLDLLSPPTAP